MTRMRKWFAALVVICLLIVIYDPPGYNTDLAYYMVIIGMIAHALMWGWTGTS